MKLRKENYKFDILYIFFVHLLYCENCFTFDQDILNRHVYILDFKSKALIGAGAYGKVYQISNKIRGEAMAIKIHDPSQDVCKGYQYCKECKNLHTCTRFPEYPKYPKEILILEDIQAKIRQHPNRFLSPYFLRYYGCNKEVLWASGNEQPTWCWWHAMELMPSNLLDLIKGAFNSKCLLNESLIKKIIYFILCSVNTLHCYGYIHRDLKPENILLSKQADDILSGSVIDFRAVISDFGMAKEINYVTKRPETPGLVTLTNRPPEIAENDKDKHHYGKYTDTWSIGMIFLTLIKLENPVWEEYKKIQYLVESNVCTEEQCLDTAINKALNDNSVYDCQLLFNWWSENYPKVDLINYGVLKQINNSGYNLSSEGFRVLCRMLIRDPLYRPCPTTILNDPYWYDTHDNTYKNVDWAQAHQNCGVNYPDSIPCNQSCFYENQLTDVKLVPPIQHQNSMYMGNFPAETGNNLDCFFLSQPVEAY